MTVSPGRVALLLITGAITLIAAVWLDGSPSPTEAEPPPEQELLASDYMPLQPGRRLIYASDEGDRFALTFHMPVLVEWFDGSSRELHPVHDQRCGCHVMFQVVDGEVRAVASVLGGRLDRWGEYVLILPRSLGRPQETVETPAGRFDRAVSYPIGEGTAWFAPGVGMVKTGNYSLVSITLAARYMMALTVPTDQTDDTDI